MNNCISCKKSETVQGNTKVFANTHFRLLCRKCHVNIGHVCGGCGSVMNDDDYELYSYCKVCKRENKLEEILEI